MATNRRVVVTGLGTVNPLGSSVQESWTRLICAHSGINSTITLPKISKTFPIASISAEIQSAKKEILKYPRWIQLAMHATKEAIESSSLLLFPDLDFKRTVKKNF